MLIYSRYLADKIILISKVICPPCKIKMDKKIVLSLLLFTSLTGLTSTALYAQKPDPDADVNLWVQQPIKVDGISNEWHEPLNNYNTETKLAFALANDQQNLYLIIESLDEVTTRKLLTGGLTLDINTAGKKKDGMKLNFLGMNQPPSPHDKNDTLSHQTADSDHENGPAINMIQVSGFKNIPDGPLTMPNKDGIEIAAAFNKQRDYICELAIPLSQLGLKGNEVKPIAYNIKINAGVDHHGTASHDAGASGKGGGTGGGMRGGGGGMRGGGMGGGMGGGGKHGGGGMGGRNNSSGTTDSQSPKAAADFWIKYELAKPTDSFRAN